ncbi:hypothetical protein DFR67_11641 [Williamsia limnetica]|uniref:Uncharacterized protein n=1 Tax=Williamsia limnetica TaxID=882452 RepID=A0A318RIQ2_WILLI|nr:hypothetical protein [Williamsia limnetica]PYE13487.1 hypothetical protein DFR67_11641 [Williamsia limnetica]
MTAEEATAALADDPAQLLGEAEQALIDAGGEPEASTRRRCHAHHAAVQASDVIVRPESTPTQREQARSVLRDALAWSELDRPSRVSTR